MSEIDPDQQLKDLERAVLHLTGSPEKVDTYRQLAARIGGLAGQPFLWVEQIVSLPLSDEPDRVEYAVAGIMTGALITKTHNLSGLIDGADFFVALNPVLTYNWDPKYVEGIGFDRKDLFLENEDCRYFDARYGLGTTLVGSLELNQNGGLRESLKTDDEMMYFGQAEIDRSPYLRQGVSMVMDRLSHLDPV